MKKLDLEVIQKSKGQYIIHLGRGSLVFKSHAKAVAYLTKYRRVLKDSVEMLNVIQPQINALYRQNILMLDEDTQRAISFELKAFDERFDYIFKSFSPGNKNAMVFSNIQNCFDSLESCLSLLYHFSKVHKVYSLKATCRPLLKNLEGVNNQFLKDKHSLEVIEGYVKEVKVQPLKKHVS